MVAFPIFQAIGAQRWRVHASAVRVHDGAVLMIGPPASGKSVHAAYLISQGGVLIGDDYVFIQREGDHLYAEAVPEVAGVLALDGFGLLSVPYEKQPVRLTHVLQLAPSNSDPLAFTGCALAPYPKPAEDVLVHVYVVANELLAKNAALPPDWMPKHVQKH